MSQFKKHNLIDNDITFALLLLIFSFFSHIALGILDNYLANLASVLALGLLLFTLRKHSKLLFLIGFLFIFVLSLGYLPSGLLYGPVSIGVIASVYETNFSETIGFFKAIPLSIYIFTFFYLLLFIVILLIQRHKTSNKSPKKIYAAVYLGLVAFSLYTPIEKEVGNTDPEKEFKLSEFFKASNFYPVSFLSNAIKVNNTYGYPQKTTPFLEHVNGLIFDLYVAAGPNTQPSLQRTLYRSINNNEETVYTDNIISLAKLAHYKTYWLSNQGKVGEWDTMASRIGIQADESFFTKKGGYDSDNIADTALLAPLKQLLAKDKDQTKLIVLHLIGSHPTFCAHLNGEEPKFHLISREMSCYLDTLKQTDSLLSEVNQILKDQGQSYSVIYFSDHGLAHLGTGKNLSMLNNKEYKQSYAVPFVRFSSDDTKRTLVKNPQSAFNFIHGFAQWLGIKESHLSQEDFFNPKPQTIKVFNWRALVDYNSLKEDPAKQEP